MIRNPKTRAKKPAAQDLCPPTSRVCINALDLASAVTSYTPRTLKVQDIPQIPVYNREKNKIRRFSRIVSVPVYGTGASQSEEEFSSLDKRVMSCQPLPKQRDHPTLPMEMYHASSQTLHSDPLLHARPAFNPSLGLPPSDRTYSARPLTKFALSHSKHQSLQSKHESFSEYSDASSITFSVNSTKSPAGKRNSTFDSPYHRRSFSANSIGTGPSNISHIDLSEELDNNSFYEYYFNKSYFEDTDSLFSGSSASPKVPPKSTRRVVSEIPRSSYTKHPTRKPPLEVCLDICADYENSRFMIPKSHQIRTQNRISLPLFSIESKQKSLPSVPEPKLGIRQRISSGTKHRLSRIFSK